MALSQRIVNNIVEILVSFMINRRQLAMRINISECDERGKISHNRTFLSKYLSTSSKCKYLNLLASSNLLSHKYRELTFPFFR